MIQPEHFLLFCNFQTAKSIYRLKGETIDTETEERIHGTGFI